MQPETTPRGEVLLEAKRLIEGDRNVSYGSPTQNFANTAALLNVQFGHKLSEPFTAADVAVIMMQLKLARLIASPKRDTWVDIAGYAACGYEASLDKGASDDVAEAPKVRARHHWAPGSAEPIYDVYAVRSLLNGVVFEATGVDAPGRRWRALPASGGDGGYYTWAEFNGLSGDGADVTEVFVEELK